MTYNPNQPRDPAGSETGGQWTGEQLDIIERAVRKAAGLEQKVNTPTEQQRADRRAEKEKEFEALPISVRRAMAANLEKELRSANGGYVDGGYNTARDVSDAKALWEFENSSTKRQKDLLAEYKRYARVWVRDGSIGEWLNKK